MALIVDEKMPKNGCTMCFAKAYSEIPFYNICKITSEEITEHICAFTMPPDCSIKGEIPDKHGRLIDADVIGNWLREQHVFSMPTTCKIDSIIKDTPTVIEASTEREART